MGSGKSAAQTALGQFPRTNGLPKQSAKYWAKEKDRYLRQLLINDIEAATGRRLIVYFSQLSEQIDDTDPDDLAEILSDVHEREADLFIQTPGGLVDATEKMVSVLQKKFSDYRVIVPSWAKSAGTVIALSSSNIVLGINSELGPIDPNWEVEKGLMVPCELIAEDPKFDDYVRAMARLQAERMTQMTTALLAKGMMRNSTQDEIDGVIIKLSTCTGYKSHGAVIDFDEVEKLGLSATYLEPEDDLWKRIWLLYCLYDYDTRIHCIAKILEGRRFSIARPLRNVDLR